ncbi:carbohydrate ABC transporter permease [Brachybacterium alimentarium]|uniref:Sugar ABC transporter permease n=2 Tax=Brachybacterium alimentarium TaxID=47845 RepID=A0A2A3YFQ9_9MICO|nr:sugar ABC transporter permease [Brachybacterium alimentarium]PCC33087.1 sugar ABC transporter permease [Brachybacterium alimentarium]PCC38612.1 sugar ABC transporter permease [Brachybacterium alimentarium]RCS64790.1 sugar ABC transporter permease [Brachybacterium alimentarium]RCS66635.1 sugar ABC transporter permease [Brachybacterium alimentarium]RCS75339.1 sugar ABC transporter permease [Brachybacterium alimentarium]
MKGLLGRYGAPLLMILPSILLIGVFVYGLLGANFWTSMTDNHTAGQASGRKPVVFVGLSNYLDLLATEDFRHSLVNLVLFTVTFLVGALVVGFVWAWLLERPIVGGRAFQTVYLFPMAISFVASGVVWRWLLNSNQGESASGLNRLFQMIGLDSLQNPWWNNVTFGITAIALPAIWQLSGYVMALFLAGFRGVPEELREAARMDGASEWQVYRLVIFPQLTPVLMSAVVIIAHMSLKSFDLIMSISSPSAYQTKVPAVDMFVFKSSFDYANSAAVGAFLLIIIAFLIIPYLVQQHRSRTR